AWCRSVSSSRVSGCPVQWTTNRVGVVDQSMPPSASNSSPSASKRLNFRLLEPALQTKVFIVVSNRDGALRGPVRSLHQQLHSRQPSRSSAAGSRTTAQTPPL